MIIIKKYNTSVWRFVLFLTILQFASCGTSGIYNSKIEARKTTIDASIAQTPALESYIAPYRDSIDHDLATVLSYAPETFDKSKGKGDTTIGNLLAAATFTITDKLFLSTNKIHVDATLLNHGGIRSIIPKGPVTTRTAFEIMPFENSLKVVALKGSQVKEMANYIVQGKKPHPLAGITIIVDANGIVKNVTIQDKPVENDKVYYISTIDYLIGGGDNMAFFASNEGVYDLEYKLRDLYIDYFKKTDTLPVITTQHIITE